MTWAILSVMAAATLAVLVDRWRNGPWVATVDDDADIDGPRVLPMRRRGAA